MTAPLPPEERHDDPRRVSREEFDRLVERVRELESRLDQRDDYEREMRDRDV